MERIQASLTSAIGESCKAEPFQLESLKDLAQKEMVDFVCADNTRAMVGFQREYLVILSGRVKNNGCYYYTKFYCLDYEMLLGISL